MSNIEKLEARLDGIGHLLADRYIMVPPYQRAYSWTDEQIEELRRFRLAMHLLHSNGRCAAVSGQGYHSSICPKFRDRLSAPTHTTRQKPTVGLWLDSGGNSPITGRSALIEQIAAYTITP